MDVKISFLQPKAYKDVYLTQPKIFVLQDMLERYVRCKRSIYRFKKATVSCSLHFDEANKEFGFFKMEDGPCVYKRFSMSVVVFLGNDIPTLQFVKTSLGKLFDMKDLGDDSYMLGIYINRARILLGTSENTYIYKVLK